MQYRFAKLALLSGLLFSAWSCEKDENRAILKKGADLQLTSSATTASITTTTDTATALKYTWTAADFGYQAATVYTLQFAPQGTNFADKVVEYNLGNALSKRFSIKEVNAIYNGLDCNLPANPSATPLDVRIKASVGDIVAPMMSGIKTLTATPYQAQTLPADTWGIIGSATSNGWNSSTSMPYDFCSRTYRTTVTLTDAAGSDEFKFRANDAWTLNYGDDGGDGKLEAGGANIKVPATGAGEYQVILDLNATPKPTYTLTKI